MTESWSGIGEEIGKDSLSGIGEVARKESVSGIVEGSGKESLSGIGEEDRNNQSMVLYLKYKNFDMLLTGDVEMAGEKEILSYIDQMGLTERVAGCEVLKVAHHGSKGSSCEEFIDALHPKISLISYGKNNYGHPHELPLQRLESVDSKIMSTMDCGAISIKIKRRKMSVERYLDEK